jgi:TolB-like protein
MNDRGAGGYRRFLAELKRRKVFKVAAVYGVVAFGVVQVADLLFPALLLPDAMFRGFVVVLLLGFPIAVVLAWAFETTPEGIKRTGDAESGEITQIIGQPAAKRWPSGLLALAGVIMLTVGGVLALRSGASGTGTGPGAASPAVDRLTIAALPFSNMSGDDTSAVFTAGIHDDILTQLSKIAALHVTSRTSVHEYRDTDKSVKEIAAELGVANVLEGGVRRSGNRVRINVQLIDATTDVHLWAETFDRELTAENVFEIQGEIARAVATALEAELTAEEEAGLGDAPTRSLEALDAYHRGQVLLAGVNEQQIRAAVQFFERAVELDPGFGLAWAGLTRAHSWLLRNGLETDPGAAFQNLERAREVAPDAPETHLAAGYYHYYALGDYEQALAEFEAAEAGMPNSSGVLAALGRLHRARDRAGPAERVGDLEPRVHAGDARRSGGGGSTIPGGALHPTLRGRGQLVRFPESALGYRRHDPGR